MFCIPCSEINLEPRTDGCRCIDPGGCGVDDLGVVKEGAYADLLLVEGNPIEDLSAVTDQDNLKIIMKDGKIYKNTL